ncbi:MAG: transglutaminase-like domain-containing protein [Nanoarchaeota archaeon]|nr:transglutaminase-like domain-containing protein [Nanoarchaeota archaeon]
MKKEVILSLVIVLFLIPFCLADDSWLHNSEKLVIELNISSSMNIVPESKDYFVDYVKAKLSFFPENDFQQRLVKLETSPDSFKKEDIIEFKWEQPDEKELYFLLNSEVETENKLKKITGKIRFPLKNLDEEYAKYTKPTENIDLNDNIIKIASELAEGEDDLYAIAHKLAEWVSRNIEYDIKYGTSTKKSSWVLKNKIGTCDEFSSLFIALCRALGIPARYVSGVAYSNIAELEGFGNHAWADVYFSDYGWVPFDPTYGEFGFINPSHIKLKSSLDSGNTSTGYEWKGHGFDIIAEKLDIDAEVKKISGIKEPLIKIKADILRNNVGFGSYNLIEATIENLNSYYVPITLRLSVPLELDAVEGNKKNVLLMPNEIKKVYWIVRLTEDLKRNYIYTLPITVYDLSNISSTSSFESRSNDLVISKQTIDALLEDKIEEKLKVYSRKVDLKCNSDKGNYYIDESILVYCSIKNTGNIFLNNVKVCLENDCKILNLGIAQEKNINFSTKPKGLGKKQILVKAKNDQVSKTSYLGYNILDYPNITISDLSYPAEVLFNKDYSVSFMLNKSSDSIPKNIEISLLQNSFSEKWSLKELDNNRVFNINLNSKTLREGKNDLEIIVNYEDDKSKGYETKKNFIITLAKLSFPQKVLSLLYSLDSWLESLF